MLRFYIFTLMLATNMLVANISASSPFQVKNPISKGLHPYGMRDFQLFVENNRYYLLGTEMAKPGTEKRGIVLYSSTNLSEWVEVAVLVDRKKLKPDCWFYDEFKSPKITKINNKFYLTFSANNQTFNPYGSAGVVVAVATNLKGPYSIKTKKQALTTGNNFSLTLSRSNDVVAFWDRDGKIFSAKVDINRLKFPNQPTVAIDQGQLRRDDHFLDAPNVFYDKGKYYLLYSVFKGGYRISFAKSESINGPWEAQTTNDVFYRSEDQAPTMLKMTYPKEKTYAPPCEIIGHAQLFVDLDGKLRLAYHSEDKYAEPYLCIDKADIIDGKVICNPTLQ